ncbi:hypothetical protein T439DRAFT_41851 [Meredithblackwellia eburnea MCA 4105]
MHLGEDELEFLGELINNTAHDIAKAYKGVRLVKARYSDFKKEAGLSKSEVKKFKKNIDAIDNSYADCLNDVMCFAGEEAKQVKSGDCALRLQAWIQEQYPDWEKAKVLSELKQAKSLSDSLSKALFDGSSEVDVLSGVGQWLLRNPFTIINRTGLKLRMYQTGISSSDVKKGLIPKPSDKVSAEQFKPTEDEIPTQSMATVFTGLVGRALGKRKAAVRSFAFKWQQPLADLL